jgi:hypothetical protein
MDGETMTLRGFLQTLICAWTGRRCVFCDREVCAFYPNGNPFIDTEYRKAMERYESFKGERK